MFFWWLTNSSQSNATHNPLQLLVSKCFQPPSSFKELRLSTILHIEWICIAGGQCLAIRHIFQWGIQMGWCFNCGNQTWQVNIITCKYWEITCKHSESLNKLTKHSWESTINVVFIGKSSVNIRKWSMAGDVYNSCATSEARHAMTVGTRTQNWRFLKWGYPNSWMVYNETSDSNGWLGVPPFQETTNSALACDILWWYSATSANSQEFLQINGFRVNINQNKSKNAFGGTL